MGMSASQARLLYLTAQLNNLSLKGQLVSDAKMRLALDTQQIQERYIKALNSSRLFLDTNIFTAGGMAAQSQLITLDNLRASGLRVSDGSKILGYNWEKVVTGTYQAVAGYVDGAPIYPLEPVPSSGFSAPPSGNAGFNANTATMQTIVSSTGLGTNDLEVMTYTTNINGATQNLDAIVIKSQEGFDAILAAIQNDIANGDFHNTLEQNFVFDDNMVVDMSNYTSAGIPYFQGVFDGNGVTINGLNGTQGLFRDLYGVAKNININGAVISAETDAIGGLAGYLGEGGIIENCNVTNVSITCTLHNTDYPEGYDSERAGVGGVVGYNNGSIHNTAATGTINVPYADSSFGYIGGFIGANVNTDYGSPNNVIENCYSDVNIYLGSGLDYSNSINGFIGDDTYETIINNCISLGSITNAGGFPINGTDLANWGPVLESNITNMMALDTRNNNSVLYWQQEDNPYFGNGQPMQPPTFLDETVNVPLVSGGNYNAQVWLNPGAPGYTDQIQTTAINNGLAVLNLSELQSQGLVNGQVAPNTSMDPIGYQQIPQYEMVDRYEMQLVEDPTFQISSRALEEGLRSGAYMLVKETDSEGTQTVSIGGVFYETIALDMCTMITDRSDENAMKKAEVEYERDMADIQAKDKKYEMDQKKIDTQYQAYLQEEESLKNVLSKNIENSYNTFKA